MDLQELLNKWNIKCDVNTLLAMWNESHRYYHTLNHLNDLIEQINESKSKYSDKEYEKLMLEKYPLVLQELNLIVTAAFLTQNPDV